MALGAGRLSWWGAHREAHFALLGALHGLALSAAVRGAVSRAARVSYVPLAAGSSAAVLAAGSRLAGQWGISPRAMLVTVAAAGAAAYLLQAVLVLRVRPPPGAYPAIPIGCAAAVWLASVWPGAAGRWAPAMLIGAWWLCFSALLCMALRRRDLDFDAL